MRQGVFTPKLKLLWHRQEITNWLEGKNIPPIMVEIDLTNRCNLKCNFCTFDYIKDKSDIDYDSLIRCIRDLAYIGVKSINFTGGGEPTLHNRFVDILKYTHRMGIEIGLFTNGMLLSKDSIDAITDCCSWVRVSIDAGTREVFKQVKGVDGYDDVIQNTELLVESKAKKHSACTVGIGFVITKDNYSDIPLFGFLSKELHVDYAQYKPEIKNMFSNKQIEAEWWERCVRPLLEDEMERNPIAVINLYKFNDLCSNIEREYGVCYGHNFVPCIGATGDVWICTHLRNVSGFSMGNIKDKRFLDIWDGEERKKAVSKIDLSKCQKYCRNNEINKVLWSLKENKPEGHYNFL